MNDWSPVIIAIAAGIPGLVAAMIGLLNRQAVREVHLAVNSRLDQLLVSSNATSRAEGVVLGRQLRPDSPGDEAVGAPRPEPFQAHPPVPPLS